jgi:hypothetical protein
MEGPSFWLVLLAAIVLLGLALLGMAIGALTTGRCLRGSCGGPDLRLPDGQKISCATCPNRRTPPSA